METGLDMDNSLTLARHFARLVWLLMHERQSKKEQKASLRAAVLVAKDTVSRLGRKEDQLLVNGLVMPQALAGVRELAERFRALAIEEVVVDAGATATELLTLARLLVVGNSSAAEHSEFFRLCSELRAGQVQLRMAAGPAAVSSLPSSADAPVITESPASRAEKAVGRLSGATTALATSAALIELASAISQACREGRTGDAADLWTKLHEREATVADPEVKRAYESRGRSLMRPTFLRAVAGLLSTDSARRRQVEKIVERCGRDGADVLVDHLSAAPTLAGRELYRDVLFRHPRVHESLIQMLAASRWQVARQAADLLGDLKSGEAEAPLAVLLKGGGGDERVRRAAARALGRIESASAIDALVPGLRDSSSLVRLETIAALANRRGTRAGAALVTAIDHEGDAEVQFAILAALGRVATPDAVQKLIAAAAAAGGLFKQKKNSGLRVAAVVALREARTAAALSALKGLANDREKDVKDAVARALSVPSAAFAHAKG